MEIKNCPFCGSECEVRSTTFGDSMTEYYCVECKADDAHCLNNWDDTPEDAIKTWNQRPNDVTKQDDVRNILKRWKDAGLIEMENLPSNGKFYDNIEKVYIKTIPQPPEPPKARIIKEKGLFDFSKDDV